MKEKLNDLSLQMVASMKTAMGNERGSQTLEWIGIAAVIVILVGVISSAFSKDTVIGTTLVTKFTDLVKSIGGE